MLKVGLTGGIGCGKTTVSNHFKALGVPVIDADEISRELVQPGLPAYRAIVEAFGPSILTPRGELDRAGLRRLIFADTEAKLALEAILHPRIQQTISDKIKTLDSQYCIIVIPLLVETGEYSLLDRVLVIDAARELQISRTLARDKISREQVEAMLASQVDRTTRLGHADDILNNDGDINQLHLAVERLHQKYLRSQIEASRCVSGTC